MKLSRKHIFYILVLAVVIAAVSTVGVVYAKYVSDIPGSGEITVTPAKLDLSVSSGSGSGEYIITADSGNSMPCYIRCAVVVNWVDEENGTIWAVPPSNSDYDIDADDFELESDGYYYYDGVAAPGDNFSIIVTPKTSKSGYKLHVQILAECIQTVPASAVELAWEKTYSGTEWN